jgi:hypothetical protein
MFHLPSWYWYVGKVKDFVFLNYYYFLLFFEKLKRRSNMGYYPWRIGMHRVVRHGYVKKIEKFPAQSYQRTSST